MAIAERPRASVFGATNFNYKQTRPENTRLKLVYNTVKSIKNFTNDAVKVAPVNDIVVL